MSMSENTRQITRLADGVRSSREIAEQLGISPRYVRRVMSALDLPQLYRGAQPRERNHQFLTGRRVDLNGYVLVTAPTDHPTARLRKGRNSGLIYEHRLVMEQTLGRYLTRAEVPDHIDGLTLHNEPSNLRLFPNNSAHLHQTLRGKRPKWSADGLDSMKAHRLGEGGPPVDIYRLRKVRGEIRLQQILLAALSLGIDSPYLLGTHHHLTKAEIDWRSRPTIERALADLYLRWGWNQTR
jgi:hypothetical protein